MKRKWQKTLASFLAMLLLVGALGAGPAYAGGSLPPQGEGAGTGISEPASTAPEAGDVSSDPSPGEGGSSAVSSQPSEAPSSTSSSAAPPASSDAVPPSAPPASSGLPGDSSASSQPGSSAEPPDRQEAEVSAVAAPAPEDWLLELQALARSDAAATAALLNAQADAAWFETGLKAVLDIYYGEDLADLLAAFSAALDTRAADILAAYAAAAAERAAAAELGYVPGEVLLVFEPGVGEAQAVAVTEQHEADLTATVDTPEPEVSAVAEIPLNQTVEQAVETLQEDPLVQYAQPVYLYTVEAVPTPNDTYRGEQWGTDKIDTLGAWELLQNAGLNPAANRVDVTVVDTAIQAFHPDLTGTINHAGLMNFANGASSAGMPADYDGSAVGDRSHGTHVTGIIGATANNGIGTYGVASGMQNNYISYTAYNAFLPSYGGKRWNSARSDDVARAINYAVSQGADVINLSLGKAGATPSQTDMILKTAMQNAWNNNVVVVTAAGNDGSDAPGIPGSFGLSVDVINLMDGDYTNPGLNPRSSSSNYGADKTISAPGTKIASTIGYQGDPNYAYLSGTSMAAPMVSGVVALMKYANPHLTVAQVHHILKVTATDTYTPGFDNQTAWGCVNAKAAVQLALNLARYGGASSLAPEGPASRVLAAGQSLQLQVKTQPATSGEQLLWASSNPGVVQVNHKTGLATAVANGTATVTGTSSRGYTVQYTLRVGDGVQTGWVNQNGSRYYYLSNGQPATGWQSIEGAWYYFGTSGQMQTGWLWDGANWFYLQDNGQMATGQLNIGGTAHRFAQNGVWQGAVPTGSWKDYGGRWCYLYNNGSWAYGWAYIDGSWYHFDNGGYMNTGWLWDGAAWYYLQGGGQMQTGWLWDGSTWYYFGPGGQMQTGWVHDGSNWYHFAGNGPMHTGWYHDGAAWYYLSGGGQMQTGWLWDGSSWYYMNSSGQMQTGWLWDGSTWYYLSGSGQMQTGWLWDGAAWYYLQASGAMTTGQALVDGAWQNFAANGVWLGAA